MLLRFCLLASAGLQAFVGNSQIKRDMATRARKKPGPSSKNVAVKICPCHTLGFDKCRRQIGKNRLCLPTVSKLTGHGPLR